VVVCRAAGPGAVLAGHFMPVKSSNGRESARELVLQFYLLQIVLLLGYG
jgi:hypothetical protein